MTCAISHTSVDCRDAFAQAQWWKQVLGHVDDPDDPDQPGDPVCWIQADGGGQPLLFIEVAEGKAVKNRLHLDLRPTDRSRDEEVDRVLGLGATLIADHRGKHGPGTGRVVLGDPRGTSSASCAAGASSR